MNMANANLAAAKLTYVRLVAAYMDGSDLTNADLSGADLTDGYLDDANLTGAKLSYTHLKGAVLRRANLTGAKSTRREPINPVSPIHTVDLIGTNLTDADLTCTKLTETF